MKTTILVHDKRHLNQLIKEEIKLSGLKCDLNHLDVSQVTDMAYVFSKSRFNGEILKWDVSKVRFMHCMFYESKFNGELSEWNVSQVVDMNSVFLKSRFNNDISNWDVSRVIHMCQMFKESQFNGDLSCWTPYKLKFKDDMFTHCSANRPSWYYFDDVEKGIKAQSFKDNLENQLSPILPLNLPKKVKI